MDKFRADDFNSIMSRLFVSIYIFNSLDKLDGPNDI